MPSRTAAPSSAVGGERAAGTRALHAHAAAVAQVRQDAQAGPPAAPAAPTRSASASATVLTMLAPIASRQSTWTCTIDAARDACAPRARARRRRDRRGGAASACASASSSALAASTRLRRAVRIVDADDLDLRGHHRIVGVGDEAAALAHHARGVRRRGDHRRLLDRHRHQVVAAVDQEVQPDARAAARRRRPRSRPRDRRSRVSMPPPSSVRRSSFRQVRVQAQQRAAARRRAGGRSRGCVSYRST